MSANITKKNGKYSIMVVGEPAWHGLGQVLPQQVNSAEAIIEAGLDFHVDKRVSRFMANDGSIKEYNQKFITVRQDLDLPLGCVGTDYEVIQNTEAFDFFDDIVGKGEAIYTTAGALYNGEVIFITAKLPDYISVKNHGLDDKVDKYLLLMNSHDSTSSITVMFTPVRVVCMNTLQSAIHGKGTKIKIKHTKDAHSRLNEAQKALGMANRLSNDVAEIFNHWVRTPIKDTDVQIYLAKTLLNIDDYIINEQKLMLSNTISKRSKNILSSAYQYYHSGLGQDNIVGTLYGAYNAVTGIIANTKTVSDELKATAYSKRADSILFGNGYKKSQYAFDLAKFIDMDTTTLTYSLII